MVLGWVLVLVKRVNRLGSFPSGLATSFFLWLARISWRTTFTICFFSIYRALHAKSCFTEKGHLSIISDELDEFAIYSTASFTVKGRIKEIAIVTEAVGWIHAQGTFWRQLIRLEFGGLQDVERNYARSMCNTWEKAQSSDLCLGHKTWCLVPSRSSGYF